MDSLELLDEIRVHASNGLAYADNDYDRARYERLLELAEQHYGEALDLPTEIVRERLRRELGHITPKVGSDGAIFDDAGRLLLMKRAPEGTWCLPCGWLEPHETPPEAVVREVFEETGLVVRARRLVGVFGQPAGGAAGPHAVVSILYLCDIEGGELVCSDEGLDLRYRVIEDVSHWHAHHRELALAARAAREDRTA
jgi:ADP-ribose pyrophosphatase YjhB (NUDIX family)